MRRIARLAWLGACVGMVAGCYVVPMRAPDGTVYYDTYPLPPVGTPIAPPGTAPPPTVMPGAQLPAVLNARLYPANEAAAAGGVISGTVTNFMTGKGRFQVNLLGEVLTGEATRVSNEERRGIASAYGSRGTIMSCDYQMTTPYQGTGECRLSTGAIYTLHLGGN